MPNNNVTDIDSHEAKIAGMICLGLGTLVVGLLPAWFSSHGRQWPILLSSLLCFGGGVLLSTSMVHILPELREVTEHAELLFCAGFFILYLIDEVVHFFWALGNHNRNNAQSSQDEQFQGNVRRRSFSTKNNIYYGSGESTSLLARSESNIYSRQQSHNPTFLKAHSHENLYNDNLQPSQICHVSHTEPCHDPPISQFGLLFALSVHAILEGLAIGLEKSTAKVWLLVGAVASHKLVVGFCLGVELSSGIANTACKHFVAITVFSMGSIAGIAIGMTLTDLSNDWANTAEPILQGLAGGTLLYVTVCEVLPRERARWHNQSNHPYANIVQFISVAVGFTLTTIISKYLEFDHVNP